MVLLIKDDVISKATPSKSEQKKRTPPPPLEMKNERKERNIREKQTDSVAINRCFIQFCPCFHEDCGKAVTRNFPFHSE